MKMPSWPVLIGVAVVVIVAVVVSIMFRLGSFKPVEFTREKTVGPYILLSRDHLGPYHEIAGVISAVESWARSQGETCTLTFGEYFDDPNQTDEDRLKSRGGCLVSTESKAAELEKKLPEGITINHLAIGESLIASFDGSPSIGPIKVYPAAFDRMRVLDLEPAGAIFEIYEVLSPTEGRTKYVFPVKSLRH